MGRKRKRTQSYVVGRENDQYSSEIVNQEPNVKGAYQYRSKHDLPWDYQRYWAQRFDFFSRYNEGVWMTEDAWFEVTPESIATKIAEHISLTIPDKRSIIIDTFCGVGGNTIAFALSGRFKRVYAIEKNEAALACAKHNAEVYGVADRITWFHGDCFEILGLDDSHNETAVGALKDVIGQFGVVFASPPWGGPGYKTAEIFDLSQMQPYSLASLYLSLSKVTRNVVLYLPRTSDLRQIATFVEDGKQTQIVHYCTYGGSRALCAYLGDFHQIDTANQDS